MTGEGGEPAEVTEDALLGGRVRLFQPRTGHRAGTDALLLAGHAGARPGDRVVDLGSASGAVGLAVAAAVPDTRVLLLDRDPALVALADRNLALNDMAARGEAACLDVFADPRSWPDAVGRFGSAHIVVTNPPFLEEGGGARPSPDPKRRAAHVMRGGGLGGWLSAASRLLGPGGRVVLIHRADALAACLGAVRPSFGSVSLRAVHPRADGTATRILVTARKGGRAPLAILPALVLHGADGRFTPEAARLHGRPDDP